MITTMSDAGVRFLIGEEGVRLRPYYDSVGVPTIGVGCTMYEDGRRVKITDPPITYERAMELFKRVLKNYEVAVASRLVQTVNQNQFDAMVSLCFNIGVGAFAKSSVLRLVNRNPADPAISAAFEMWRNAGGKPILLKRRIREAKLYFS